MLIIYIVMIDDLHIKSLLKIFLTILYILTTSEYIYIYIYTHSISRFKNQSIQTFYYNRCPKRNLSLKHVILSLDHLLILLY